MSTLRRSQVEVLRAIQSCDGERASPAMVGGLVNCSLRAARERCDRLLACGYLYSQLGFRPSGRYYRTEYGLRQSGKEALQREGRG